MRKYRKCREKRRHDMRDEITELRRSIPEAATRMQMLRLANAYIKHLENTLISLRALTLEDPEWQRKVSDAIRGERDRYRAYMKAYFFIEKMKRRRKWRKESMRC